jgi:hypothetical protein
MVFPPSEAVPDELGEVLHGADQRDFGASMDAFRIARACVAILAAAIHPAFGVRRVAAGLDEIRGPVAGQ